MVQNPPGAYPPGYQQQYPGYAPPRNPNAMVRIIALVIIIVGYASAALGVMGAFFVFGVGGQQGLGPGGAEKTYQFMTSASTALGIGAIAVAAGYLLKARVSASPQP